MGALEAKFYDELVAGLGLDPGALPDRHDQSAWPALTAVLQEAFALRTRDEWATVFDGTDACVTPVLDLGEVHRHAHNAARGVFVDVAGVTQPAPTPRFSRTPSADPTPAPASGTQTDAALAAWGFGAEDIARLRAGGVIV